MNKRINKLWVKALTGKLKKKYRQAKGSLRDNGRFCCLGVLCDLHCIEFSKKWEKGIFYDYKTYLDSGHTLPIEVVKWAGLGGINPPVVVNNERYSLAELNDKDFDFNEIAKLIKEQL